MALFSSFFFTRDENFSGLEVGKKSRRRLEPPLIGETAAAVLFEGAVLPSPGLPAGLESLEERTFPGRGLGGLVGSSSSLIRILSLALTGRGAAAPAARPADFPPPVASLSPPLSPPPPPLAAPLPAAWLVAARGLPAAWLAAFVRIVETLLPDSLACDFPSPYFLLIFFFSLPIFLTSSLYPSPQATLTVKEWAVGTSRSPYLSRKCSALLVRRCLKVAAPKCVSSTSGASSFSPPASSRARSAARLSPPPAPPFSPAAASSPSLQNGGTSCSPPAASKGADWPAAPVGLFKGVRGRAEEGEEGAEKVEEAAVREGSWEEAGWGG